MGKTCCDRPPKADCRPEKPRRRPPRPGGCCCPEGGYIVERIVGSDREDACFSGLLPIKGLPDSLCPPLCLRGVDVMQIEPVCAGAHACDMGPICGDGQRLRVTLCCFVTDSRGCRAEGIACIEIQVSGRRRPYACGVNVRRGAEIFVQSACFCPPCAFDVCLNLCINTIISRCEMVGQRPSCPPSCPPPCPDLPLYPPPIHCPPRGHRCEHFCGW